MTGHEQRLIEAVARTIGGVSTKGLPWEKLPAQFQTEFRAQAKAAIETYRNYDERR